SRQTDAVVQPVTTLSDGCHSPHYQSAGNTMTLRFDRDYARTLDRQDPLASFRDRFVIDDPDLAYLDGKSLGRLPLASQALAGEAVAGQWGRRLLRGWSVVCWARRARIGGRPACLLGPEDGGVSASDRTSVGLFRLALAALRHRP